MMTIARRNRRWTPALAAKLVSAAEEKMNVGNLSREAFEYLAPEWGATAGTLQTTYYKYRFNPEVRAEMANLSKPQAAPVAPTPHQNQTVQHAIEVLKSMGFTVTLTI